MGMGGNGNVASQFRNLYLLLVVARPSPVVDVVDAGDGPVAVERDGDEVEDGRGAAEHVERYPGVALEAKRRR